LYEKVDGRSQFHQHFTCAFFEQKRNEQHFSSYSLAFIIFWQKDIGEKSARKMLVKLRPGITFEAAKKGLRGAPGNDAEDGGEA